MSEEDTYLRAKLTEINSSIKGLTEMLNRMIDVMSKISEVQDATSETKAFVAANSQKLDALMEKVEGITVAASPAARQASIAEKGGSSFDADNTRHIGVPSQRGGDCERFIHEDKRNCSNP
jgi:hypothetical protein